MIQSVASQHTPLSLACSAARRPGTTESSRAVRKRSVQVAPGRPRNTSKPQIVQAPTEALAAGRGRRRPAQKVWRLKNGNNERCRDELPGLAGALRLFSAARTLLALVGLAVVLAAGCRRRATSCCASSRPGPRPGTRRPATRPPAPSSPAPTASALREQRAVAEFIAKRYRVAQDATAGFVATAYRAGGEWKVDPLLILAVMAVESRYNPVAESNMGAKGLMQVIPKFHADKLVEHGGEGALLDPQVNIQVGAQILREYLRRFGETETALQMYAGAFDEPSSSYAFKVLAERTRLEQMLKQLRRSASA